MVAKAFDTVDERSECHAIEEEKDDDDHDVKVSAIPSDDQCSIYCFRVCNCMAGTNDEFSIL